MPIVYGLQMEAAFLKVLTLRLESDHLVSQGMLLLLRDLQALGPLVARLAGDPGRLTDAFDINILIQPFVLENLPGPDEQPHFLRTETFRHGFLLLISA